MAAKKKTAPPPPPPAHSRRIGRLDRVAGVTRELGRLYRDMRMGRVSSNDGAKLAYVLSVVRQTLESGQLAERLDRIESELKEGDNAAD